jgi:large subunit ribosomal protein L22
MEVKAIHRGARISAQKTRLVADQIRGLPVDKALNVLTFSPKKGGYRQEGSAVGDCECRAQRRRRHRRVQASRPSTVDKAASLKRFTARAKGRGNKIEKQSCHITVTVGN